MAERFALRNVDPTAITLCKKGANGKTFFLVKMDEGTHVEQTVSRIIKADDSRVAYCVVAEPGTEELRGMVVKDGQLVPDDEDGVDVWVEEDEIRAAAHRFIKNGGLITQEHEEVLSEAVKPYGTLVETAVAPADFTINEQVIKAGSWYIGIELNDKGLAAVESGEFTGVSLSGQGERVAITKADADPRTILQRVRDLLTGADIDTKPASITHNGEAIGSESGTVESTEQEDDVADDKRVEALETKVGELETLTKSIGENVDKIVSHVVKDEPPKIEDLAKSVGEIGERLATVADGVQALAAGDSAQGGGTGNDGRSEQERADAAFHAAIAG